MSHSTYILLFILFIFTEAVLLLLHSQANAEQTKYIRNILDLENDKLKKRIEALQLSIQETRRELDNRIFEINTLKSS